jgi:hypothetical protein
MIKELELGKIYSLLVNAYPISKILAVLPYSIYMKRPILWF